MIASVGVMGTSPAYNGPPPAPPSPQERFQELDSDGNGSLDLAELQVMADRLSEMTGIEMSAEELLEKLDADGNGTLEIGEMPEPEKGGFRGPPPFLAEDGSVQGSLQELESFDNLESLLSYLSEETEEASIFSLDLQA